MAGQKRSGKEPWPRCVECAGITLWRTSARCAFHSRKRVAELLEQFAASPKARVVLQLPYVLTPIGEWDSETKIALAEFLASECADQLAPLGVGVVGEAA